MDSTRNNTRVSTERKSRTIMPSASTRRSHSQGCDCQGCVLDRLYHHAPMRRGSLFHVSDCGADMPDSEAEEQALEEALVIIPRSKRLTGDGSSKSGESGQHRRRRRVRRSSKHVKDEDNKVKNSKSESRSRKSNSMSSSAPFSTRRPAASGLELNIVPVSLPINAGPMTPEDQIISPMPPTPHTPHASHIHRLSVDHPCSIIQYNTKPQPSGPSVSEQWNNLNRQTAHRSHRRDHSSSRPLLSPTDCPDSPEIFAPLPLQVLKNVAPPQPLFSQRTLNQDTRKHQGGGVPETWDEVKKQIDDTSSMRDLDKLTSESVMKELEEKCGGVLLGFAELTKNGKGN